MAAQGKSKDAARLRRKARTRDKVVGTDEKPRLCVFRSNKFTYVQLISDDANAVIASVSTREVKADSKSASSVESAKALGLRVAEVAKDKKISSVVFDRNGYLYHGRVAAVADGAREGGLKL